MSLKERSDQLLNSVAEGMLTGSSNLRPPRRSEPGTAIGAIVGEGNQSLRDRVRVAEEALAQARQAASEALARAETAEARSKVSDKAPRVDPARVRRSAFADRDERAFSGPEFERFCELIRKTKGNELAGKVRPIEGDPDHDFELIYGHRRHAACLALKLPFKTEIEAATDDDLVTLMFVENEGRINLSAFEQGIKYARLLANGMFSSGREMAAKFEKSQTMMARLLRFAELPAYILQAFDDPREIRVQWVDGLLKANGEDPDGCAKVAEELRASRKRPTPAQVFKRLTGSVDRRAIIANNDKVVGSIRMIHDRPAVVLFKDAPDELIEKIKSVIKDWTTTHGDQG